MELGGDGSDGSLIRWRPVLAAVAEPSSGGGWLGFEDFERVFRTQIQMSPSEFTDGESPSKLRIRLDLLLVLGRCPSVLDGTLPVRILTKFCMAWLVVGVYI